ncbi:MAG TPA: CaiB/BaiF CoA-transferase family protein [Acidimicrobiales bacterium]|nr:CaiB/BaiF CoA-transferase family protein [Acidimicrobiales bacterium]
MGMLAGVRVIDLSQHGPGSRASRILADYGASVVKVERPSHRRAGQIQTAASAYGGNRGIQRLRLDLQQADGRTLLLRLAQSADVIIEAFRPGVADRLGIGPRAVHAANPRVVYCAISGFGQQGERAAWAGHDLNYAAVTGLLAQTQPRSDGGPPVLGATIGDGAGGGMHAVIAILAALQARERTGAGALLDVAAADGVLWLMSVMLDQHLDGGLDVGPVRLLSGDYACYNNYRCKDDKWLSVAALEQRFWRNLCEAIGLPDLVDAHEDPSRQSEAADTLQQRFLTRTRDDWVARLAARDTCVAPVLSIEEVAVDPHVHERGAIRFGATTSMLAGSDRDDTPAPVDLAAELDLSPRRIAELVAKGVIEGVIA